jgi:hypothetical protein
VDVIAMKFCMKIPGFVIREEIIASIVVWASSNAAEAWKDRATMRRLVNIVNCRLWRD